MYQVQSVETDVKNVMKSYSIFIQIDWQIENYMLSFVDVAISLC